MSNEHGDDSTKFKKFDFLSFPKRKTKSRGFSAEAELHSDIELVESDSETDLRNEEIDSEYEREWEREYALQKDHDIEIDLAGSDCK